KPFARRFVRHIGVVPCQHLAVDGFDVGGDDRQLRAKFPAQCGKWHAGAGRKVPIPNVLERLFGQQLEKGFDDLVAVGERWMACSMSRSRPPCAINTSSAAAVVPPGDVTFWRKTAASTDERYNNSPEPATVARASRSASSAGSPALSPARARLSASKNT